MGSCSTVSQTWAPLLLVAAPALLPLVVQVAEPGLSAAATGGWAAVVVFAVSSCVAPVRGSSYSLIQPCRACGSSSPTGVTDGHVPTADFRPAPARVLRLPRDRIPGGGPGPRCQADRGRCAAPSAGPRVVPVLASAVGGALLVAQLTLTGTTSYFFLKYLIGIELILAAWVPAAVGMLLATASAPRDGVRVRPCRGSRGRAGDPGVRARSRWAAVAARAQTEDGTASVAGSTVGDAMADGSSGALRHVDRSRASHREYVALGRSGGPRPSTWTRGSTRSSPPERPAVGERLDLLRVKLDDTAELAAPTVRKVLAVDPTSRWWWLPGSWHRVAGGPSATRPLSRRVVTWSARTTGRADGPQSRPSENADSRSCWE